MSLPDITQRFPEGARNAYQNNELYPEDNTLSPEEYKEYIEEEKRYELECEIYSEQEFFKVDKETARKIVEIKRATKRKIESINIKQESDIDDILEARGYKRVYDLPF